MLNAIAKVIAIIFHPLFVYWYIVVMMLLLNPFMFGYTSITEAGELLVRIFISVVPIPVIAILMLRGLGWAESVELRKREERIGPYIITGMIYLTMYIPVARSGAAIGLQIAALSTVLALFTAFFLNNFMKISVHAVAMGTFTTMTGIMVLYFSEAFFRVPYPSGDKTIAAMSMLYVVVLLSGLVCTSRLVTRSHNITEIYTGYLVGFFAPLVAFIIKQ